MICVLGYSLIQSLPAGAAAASPSFAPDPANTPKPEVASPAAPPLRVITKTVHHHHHHHLHHHHAAPAARAGAKPQARAPKPRSSKPHVHTHVHPHVHARVDEEPVTTSASRPYEDLIRAVWPRRLEAEAIAIARCESSLRNVTSRPNRNGSRDHGLFQLNDGGTLQELGGTISLARSPAWNVRAALRLYERWGWQPWTCARNLGFV